MRRLGAGLLVAVSMSLLSTDPAAADDGRKPVIVITGEAVVPEGREVSDVVIFDGPAEVAGDVQGSIVVFNGDATVAGRVSDDVVVFNGDLSIETGTFVGGDVVSQREPDIADGATIRGEVTRMRLEEWVRPFDYLTRLAAWLAVSVSTLVLGLLLLLIGPRAADASFEVARTRVGPAIGWGLLLFFGLPVASVLAVVTLVGIPFGLGVLLALGLLYSTGYAAGAWIVGRAIARTAPRALAFLIGLAILRVVALVPVLAGLTWFAGAVFGLGVLVVAAWRARTQAVPPMPVAPAA